MAIIVMQNNDKHLNAFKEHLIILSESNNLEGKGGRNIASFRRGIPNISDFAPAGKVSRNELFDFASISDLNIDTVCLMIMAWGGMNENHRDKLFLESSSEWLELSQQIRDGKHTRSEAYGKFASLREENMLKGMGPAYFTKLLYFLMPRSSNSKSGGMIMDQWTSCSINLIYNQGVVLCNPNLSWRRKNHDLYLDGDFLVSDENTKDNYEEFCQCMENLAASCNCSVDYLDYALQKNKTTWRDYVRKNRIKQLVMS